MSWIDKFKEDNNIQSIDERFKEAYISFPGMMFLCLLILMIIFNFSWISDCEYAYSTFTPCDNEERMFNVKLSEDNPLKQSFLMIGHEMPRLWIRFRDMTDEPGKIHFKFTDSHGNIVVEKNRILKPDPETHNMLMKFTFYEDESLKKDETYTVNMTYLPKGKNSKASIACYSSGSFERSYNKYDRLFSELKDEKGELTDTFCAFTYEYDKYEAPWFLITSFGLLFIILIFSFFYFRFRLPVMIYAVADAILTPAVVFFVVEHINGSFGRILKDQTLLIANLLPILAFYLIVLFITAIPFLASFITGIVFFVLATANHYVLLFRDRPLLPWDLLAANTAANVADGYEYPGNSYILCGALVLIAYFALLTHFRAPEKEGQKLTDKIHPVIRGFGIVGFIVTGIIFNKVYLPNITADMWNITGNYQKMGAVASFTRYWSVSKYKAPEGYDKKKCKEILEAQETVPALTNTKATNIIFVMNETFSDVRVLGDGKLPKDSYMPFLDSLTENTIRGNLYVPVFGGGTANSEFEALTGITTAYIPGIPYQNLVKKGTPSVASVLKEQGFTTRAYHPNKASNFNRQSVYPRLGFDEFFSIADMEENEMDLVRKLVSDKGDYKFVMKKDEEVTGPDFIFNVTMQNHSGYDTKDFEEEDLSSVGDFPLAGEYLKLITMSDEAAKELIEHYKNVKEPTIICFFGDHQAKIEDSFYEYCYGKSFAELSPAEAQLRYVTPFCIWANYDLPEKTIDKMSSNYLGPLVMRAAGYEVNGFFSYITKLSEKYPVITPSGILDAQGNYYSASDIQDEDIENYKRLGYYELHKK